MNEVNLSGAVWRKSSRSGNGASCVDVAYVGAYAATRDSKNPTGPVLTFPSTDWRAFIGTLGK